MDIDSTDRTVSEVATSAGSHAANKELAALRKELAELRRMVGKGQDAPKTTPKSLSGPRIPPSPPPPLPSTLSAKDTKSKKDAPVKAQGGKGGEKRPHNDKGNGQPRVHKKQKTVK
ncbi:hypothetical protein OF846_002918 [Rhodotorula toruloides]|nr:hypothetical protein OF846_002918 [Rhodotorula toruloides]